MTMLLRSFVLIFAFAPAFVGAQQLITLNDVEEGLPDIVADEPLAAQFPAQKAAQYLARSALNWQKTKKCATCHTDKSVVCSIFPRDFPCRQNSLLIAADF